jgi:major vault protein
MPDHQRERDLVLAPNEYAFISDQTKGNINVYVGPYKTSLANTDQPVYFDSDSKRFIRCSLEDSTRVFLTAPEGWYLVMKNPARNQSYPTGGTINNLVPLEVGHKINISGPCSFALWPGQMSRVIKGHHIRSNQYLVVRVYDEEAARQSWQEAVIKPQGSVEGEAEPVIEVEEVPPLTMGQQMIIKGTSVSFYIPPTGIEVVRDEDGQYVRQAVTLERLEYCILRDEDGEKRFIQGPAVVFPHPTEVFVERQGTVKFKAIELNEISGIYLKVITPYQEGDREYHVGEELFITGKEQMIYFPQAEHAIIRYGGQEIHYAVAIPEGEGRYVMDRQSGQISLVKGPKMFLADPRKEVIVRRILDDAQVQLWFPNNQEALAYNQQLRALLGEGSQRHLPAISAKVSPASDVEVTKAKRTREDLFAGDELDRKTNFTQPRTLTLNTKYEGAVTIGLWTGYAALVVSKSGDRKVIVGPQSYLLAYDESLESMSLSIGTPKSEQARLKTCYMRVMHNKVSDEVLVETQDLCKVRIKLSYRVNFEGEPLQWFSVDNYVKFLTDHMRSVLRSAVKREGVQTFYADAVSFVREVILGATPEDGGKRPGRRFSENGMHIYDVEVLGVTLGDDQIAAQLTEAQHSVVHQTLQLSAEQRKRDLIVQTETIKRELNNLQAQTQLLALETEIEQVKKRLAVSLEKQSSEAQLSEQRAALSVQEEEAQLKLQELKLAQQSLVSQQALEVYEREMRLRIEELKAEVEGTVSRAEAISPDLIAALQSFSDRAMVERVSESMSPLAILGGSSVADVLHQLLRGTPLDRVLNAWSNPVDVAEVVTEMKRDEET